MVEWDDWEILPTKTKDKYYVKQRTTSISRYYQEKSESEELDEKLKSQ